MIHKEDNATIQSRLATPPDRSLKRVSATALVRENFEAIQKAHQRDRGLGKSWKEIGRDLNPSDPVSAAAVSKAIQRVGQEFGAKTNRGRGAIKVKERRAKIEMAETTTCHDGPPSPEPIRRNPFAHAVDPIRLSVGGSKPHG